MNNQEFYEWMNELRSGKYTKIRGSMGEANVCCALGVYLNHCAKHKVRYERFIDLKHNSIIFDDIANLNDSTELTLPEIADYIEKNYKSAYIKDQR